MEGKYLQVGKPSGDDFDDAMIDKISRIKI